MYIGKGGCDENTIFIRLSRCEVFSITFHGGEKIEFSLVSLGRGDDFNLSSRAAIKEPLSTQCRERAGTTDIK